MPGQSDSSDGDCVRELLTAWSGEGGLDSDVSVLDGRSHTPPSLGRYEAADAPARPRSQQGQSGWPAAEPKEDSARGDNAGCGETQPIDGREGCPEAKWAVEEEPPAKERTDCISLFAEAFGLSTHTQELLDLDLEFDAEELCGDALLSDTELPTTSGPKAEDAASQLNSPSFPAVDWLPDDLPGWEVDSADLPGISADLGSTASADAISECESQLHHAKQLARHDRHRPSARSLDFDAGQRQKRPSSRSPRVLRAATLNIPNHLEGPAAPCLAPALTEGQRFPDLVESNGLFKRARDASLAGQTHAQDLPLLAAFDQGRFDASSWPPERPLHPLSPFHSSCSQRTTAVAPHNHSSEHSDLGLNGKPSSAPRPRPPRCMSPFQRVFQEVSGQSSCLEDWAPRRATRAPTELCEQEHSRPDIQRRPTAPGFARTNRSTKVFFEGGASRLVPPARVGVPVPRPQDLQTRASAPAHAGRGFGSIMSGVLQAARTSDEHTVYRIEEMHQKTQEKKQFKGVRREAWGISWTAFLPATQFQAEQVLGCFQDPDTAARVRDVAVLRLSGGTTGDEELNFPRAQYDGEDLLEVQQAPVSEFLATLHRYGAFGERRSSRYQGVLKSSKTSFQARLPASDDEL